MSLGKAIYPGNWVNPLSSFQGQAVVGQPGRVYYHRVGYAKITTAATSWDIIIPSPDKRSDDKPRADITGLVVPNGAFLYHIGLRVLDTRKDVSRGTATSSLSATTGDLLKVASAVTTTASTQAATSASGATLAAASSTFAPSAAAGTVFHVAGAPTQATSDITLKLFVSNAAGNAAGSNVSSSLTAGSYVICEAAWFTADAAADESFFGGLPYANA